MITSGGLVFVCIQKRRFTEKDIRALGQGRDAFRILRAEERVHHIGKFLTVCFLDQRAPYLAQAEIPGAVVAVFLPGGSDHIRLPPAQGVFKRGQPRTGRNTKPRQVGAIHIQMALLFKRKRHGINAMVQMGRANAECRLIHHQAVEGLRRQRLAPETACRPKDGPPDRIRPDLRYLKREAIAVHQIPGIAAQFALNAIQDAGRPTQPQGLIPTQKHTQQSVESDEVIHMAVRDTHMAGPAQISGGEAVVMTEIEQNGPTFPAQLNIQSGVAKRPVYQTGNKGGIHDSGAVCFWIIRGSNRERHYPLCLPGLQGRATRRGVAIWKVRPPLLGGVPRSGGVGSPDRAYVRETHPGPSGHPFREGIRRTVTQGEGLTAIRVQVRVIDSRLTGRYP